MVITVRFHCQPSASDWACLPSPRCPMRLPNFNNQKRPASRRTTPLSLLSAHSGTRRLSKSSGTSNLFKSVRTLSPACWAIRNNLGLSHRRTSTIFVLDDKAAQCEFHALVAALQKVNCREWERKIKRVCSPEHGRSTTYTLHARHDWDNPNSSNGYTLWPSQLARGHSAQNIAIPAAGTSGSLIKRI